MPPIFNAVGRPAVTQLSGDAANFVNSQAGFEAAFHNPEFEAAFRSPQREAQQAQAYAQIEQQQQDIAIRGQMEREKRARQEAHYQEIGAFNANQRGVAPGGGAAQPIDPRALGDQRDQLKIGREINAITRAGQNGWSEAQVASARESLVKQYGVAGVLNAPGGPQFLGQEKEWQQHKDSSQQAFADQFTGGDRKYVRFDEQTGKPDYNGHALEFDAARARLQQIQQKPAQDKTAGLLKALMPVAPKRAAYKMGDLGQYDDEGFQADSKKYFRDVMEINAAGGDPAKLQQIMEQRAGGPQVDPAAKLEAELATAAKSAGPLNLQSSQPVDSEVAQKEVNAGRRQPGIYVDPQGRRFRVKKEG